VRSPRAEREEHAGGFDHHHDHDQRHREDQDRVDLRHAEVEGQDDVEPGRLADLLEGHETKESGHNGADHDAEQHRDVGDEALGVLHDQQDRHQHQRRDAEAAEIGVFRVGQRRHDGQALGQGRYRGAGRGHVGEPLRIDRIDERRRRGSDRVAEDPVDAHAHQADADDRDDGAGHHRRKEAQHSRDQRRDQYRDDTGTDDRAEEQLRARLSGVGVGDRHHRRDGRKSHAHHHRQLDAEPLRRAQRLDQRRDTAAEEVGGNQQCDFLRAELEGTSDDERHRHGTGIHYEHMLQAEGSQLACWQALVDGMD
jgi:hypothetical protein